MNIQGKLIVLDGTDGSGKATQTNRFKEHLEADGYKVKTLDFPRYYDNFFGQFIGECLKGEYGNWKDIHPKIASIIYACDRSESRHQIQKWLDDGCVVLLDRYVSSNQIHQGGKIVNEQERKEFMQWLEKLEHEILELPKPNIIFYLDVPVSVSQNLLVSKGNKESKEYLKGKKDQHESDSNHMEDARASGLRLISSEKNWRLINCCSSGNNMRTIEDIHEEIYSHALELLK